MIGWSPILNTSLVEPRPSMVNQERPNVGRYGPYATCGLPTWVARGSRLKTHNCGGRGDDRGGTILERKFQVNPMLRFT